MPKFLVPITRDISETTWVDVEATDPLDARNKALEEVEMDPANFNYTVDDGQTGGDPYFAGDDDLEAIELVEDETAYEVHERTGDERLRTVM